MRNISLIATCQKRPLMQRFVLVVAIIVHIAAPARADLDAGMAAYEGGDYAAALKLFQPLANQGVATAQRQLGIMYLRGQGVTTDAVQAFVWSALAAELYPTGRDRDEALRNRNAAAANMTKEQQRLAEGQTAFRRGVMYHTGMGFKQNYPKARKSYCTAIGLGIVPAKLTLFHLWQDEKGKGIGVVQLGAQVGIDPLSWATEALNSIDRDLEASGSAKLSDWPLTKECP